MPIIIRLQGLDVKAGIEDIRSFFECLHIPDGGVYILGGSLREAFIAFNSERDAQLAMRQTGTFLKGSKVTLHISSMGELERNLKSLLRRKKPSPTLLTAKRKRPSRCSNPHLNGRVSSPKTADLPPTRPLDPRKQPLNPDCTTTLQAASTPSLDSGTAFLLGICTVLQGLQSSHVDKNETVPHVDFPMTDNIVSSDVKTHEQNLESGYVRLFGLPSSTTKDDICQFFTGLTVQEVIVNVKLGINNGCLVKFATMQHASDALLFNQYQRGNVTVEVRGATEKMWTSALQECENSLDNGARVGHKRYPFRETPNQRRKSPSEQWIKSGPIKPLSSKAAKKVRLDNLPPRSPKIEYVVKVSNLPPTITKTEIKELFTCTTIPHKHVQHYLDPDGNRTDTAFIIFKNTADYDYAMNLNGCHVGSSAIEVTSVTKSMMKEMMAKTSHSNQKEDTNSKTNRRGKSDPLEVPEEEPNRTPDPAAKTCLFVRNMPADVQEGQIKSLFCKYKLAKENIFLLRDKDGNGIGEAVVQFKSSKHAALAQRLHRQDFLGSTLLITPINVKQMKDILGQ
ncbi:RNA binding motif protein 12Ba [Cheilinus undulatus]|uniref:RNA binding motif protein 12Ba n=1 Tax=Cheilinus undulatus TaxID=241271 RepID=UPI001BD6B259|nr:RNA binding motif protein 12Ba [Cheilinus undulatus]XP_041649569.1 RNA binding motif protein 12Ba [Cheilinus undulatus]